ncbi:MAG: oligosaccharide flippase family protein [Candidatus Eremiobacteraeota bacterium]|nr:oligosaccharide flippase family protein [Candidatus Eremiobacteraeota bacterium]
MFAATLLLNACNYAFHFANARLLGPAGYGELLALVNALTIASFPAAVAQTIVARFTAEFAALDEWGRIRSFSRNATAAASLAALAVLGIGTLFRDPIAAWFRVGDAQTIEMVVLIICFNLILMVIRGTLQGEQSFGGLALSYAVEGLGKAGFGIALVARGDGVHGAVTGYALAVFASWALGWRTLRSRSADAAPVRLDIRRLLQAGGAIALASGSITLLSFADMVFVKHRLVPEAAGLYGGVALIGKILLFVSAFVPLIVLPKATAETAEERRSGALLRRAIVLTTALCAAGVAILALAPALALRLVAGPAYVPFAPLLAPYGLAMMLLALANVLVNYHIGAHRLSFVGPLAAVALGELVAFAAIPPGAETFVVTVMVANGLALCAALVPMLPLRR